MPGCPAIPQGTAAHLTSRWQWRWRTAIQRRSPSDIVDSFEHLQSAVALLQKHSVAPTLCGEVQGALQVSCSRLDSRAYKAKAATARGSLD